jgi:diguanylate cyclase (GGDEF)-like protein
MREVLRGSDLKCRWGGEEFLVLLPETPLQGACRVAETLRHEIADRGIPWAHETVSAAASFGVTQALPGEINIASIVGRADAALYRAKEDGRNAVRAATETVVVVEPQERRVTESA